MPVTDGNLQDYLADPGGDTLYWKGAQVEIGTSSASTVNLIFSNSAGQIALQAVPAAGSISISLPTGSGSLLTNVNLSAGTTSNNLSAVTFSNANGISFGLNASTITASVATSLTNINVSAGTTSNNLSAITFSNSNGISFGLNGSVITATVQPGAAAGIAAFEAGTQTATSGTVVFSNSNNVSFGMSNSSVVTASAQMNVSAGTTSNNLSAVTFSNSNNVSFGLNASTLTASANSLAVAAGTQTATSGTAIFSNSNGHSFGMSNNSVVTVVYGGFSNWQNGAPVASFGTSNAFLSLQPFVVQHAITVTNILWLGSLSAATNSSGAWSVSFGLYTLSGGSTGSLSLASSGSTSFSFTSGAAYSSLSGLAYRQLSVTSWSLTPGFYVLGHWGATTNAGTHTYYGTASALSIASGLGASMSSMVLPGFSASSFTTAMPASIGVTNTSGYVRSGSSVWNQAWVSFQGT
jgi:hypothetical protein